MSIGYTEKRSFMRVNTDSKLSYKEHGSDTIHQGHCLNLSAAGVLFVGQHQMTPGTLVDINITPEVEVTEPLNATVQVVRTQLNDGGGYAIAGEIKVIH